MAASEINGLLNGSGDAASGAYFLDLTSRYFNGRISRENYVDTLSSIYNTSPDSPGNPLHSPADAAGSLAAPVDRAAGHQPISSSARALRRPLF